jgi:molybdopterin converting factor small subunit
MPSDTKDSSSAGIFVTIDKRRCRPPQNDGTGGVNKGRRNKMKINIKCFATLSEAGHCDYKDSRVTELDENADVNELIAQLGLPQNKVEIIFVNGKRVDSNHTLSDGDRVGFFPAVGGM